MRVDKLSCSLRSLLKNSSTSPGCRSSDLAHLVQSQEIGRIQLALLAPPEETMRFLGGWGLWKNDHEINRALTFRRFDVVVVALPCHPVVFDRLTDLCFIQRIEDLSAEVSLTHPVVDIGFTSAPLLQESRNLLLDNRKLPVQFRNRLGDGIRIAIIDTGVDEHPDFSRRIVARANVSGSPDDVDRVGHGTHVAGIACSSSREYPGMAPGSEIISIKVLDDDGHGTTWSVLKGLALAQEKGAHIVNLSIGSKGTLNDGRSILSNAVNKLVDTNIAVVVSAGNSGPDESSITVPADAEGALTVGACSKERELAEFSSRGPTLDGRMKPDIVAPGVTIVSARSSNSDLDPYDGDKLHTVLSGTSMSAPHVSGAMAILMSYMLWSGRPSWHVRELCEVLKKNVKKVKLAEEVAYA